LNLLNDERPRTIISEGGGGIIPADFFDAQRGLFPSKNLVPSWTGKKVSDLWKVGGDCRVTGIRGVGGCLDEEKAAIISAHVQDIEDDGVG